MDFGLYVHRNAHELLERGRGPYFYIPKLGRTAGRHSGATPS